jgi:hypothetical protein
MTTDKKRVKSQATSLNRSRIARAVFAAAESMGMSNRERIEQLVNELIEDLWSVGAAHER